MLALKAGIFKALAKRPQFKIRENNNSNSKSGININNYAVDAEDTVDFIYAAGDFSVHRATICAALLSPIAQQQESNNSSNTDTQKNVTKKLRIAIENKQETMVSPVIGDEEVFDIERSALEKQVSSLVNTVLNEYAQNLGGEKGSGSWRESSENKYEKRATKPLNSENALSFIKSDKSNPKTLLPEVPLRREKQQQAEIYIENLIKNSRNGEININSPLSIGKNDLIPNINRDSQVGGSLVGPDHPFFKKGANNDVGGTGEFVIDPLTGKKVRRMTDEDYKKGLLPPGVGGRNIRYDPVAPHVRSPSGDWSRRQ